MDSPGYCAKFCTYTFMDYETGAILDMAVVDKRETGLKSPNMEVEGFTRLLKSLKQAGVIVEEVVTDAHPQITALMSKYKKIGCSKTLLCQCCLPRNIR